MAAYLDLAFPGHAFPAYFAAAVHARTEGGPLFMADLLGYLRDRGVIAERDGRWGLARALPELWPELPEMAFVQMGIFYTGIDTDWFKLFMGAMMVIAVLFNSYVRNRAMRSR